MEFTQHNNEQIKPPENAPRLLQIRTLSETEHHEASISLVYCPPVMGESLQGKVPESVTQIASLYEVDVELYGYLDFTQYVIQAQKQLEGINPENLRIMGFSQGAALAARIGVALDLPRNRVLLVAPITSYKPSLAHIQAFNKYRHSDDDKSEESPERISENYLLRLINSQDKVYSPRGKPSKFNQIIGLERTRQQWQCTEQDLSHGTVISGSRDFVSPPRDYSAVIINATHTIKDYLPYINEAFIK